MSKDPAFLFYPNDYIGGTMGMTFEEKGAYMEVLMMQFNRGHMTEHMIGQTIGQLWVNIKDKFDKDDKGLYFNKRLEEEQIKRKKYSESRRNNKSGKNQYSKNNKNELGHMTEHMENENINKDYINIKEEIDYNKFLEWFNSRRTSYLEIPSNIKRLTAEEKTSLRLLKLDYTSEDFETAIHNLCNDKWANENSQVLPSYFLKVKTFTKFLSINKIPIITKKQKTNRGWAIC